MSLEIRSYRAQDYQAVKGLYQDSEWFDPETDDEIRLLRKILRDPGSILVAVQKPDIVGTVSLIEDGRIAIYFRLVAKRGVDEAVIRTALLKTGEETFRRRGYSQAHIMVPVRDLVRQQEFEQVGFTRGRDYGWMWKELG